MNLASVLHQLGHWGGVRMFDRHPDPSMDLLVQELIDDPVLDRAFTNTGVLFWRNSALAAENWFEQCCDLYNQSASRGYRTPVISTFSTLRCVAQILSSRPFRKNTTFASVNPGANG